MWKVSARYSGGCLCNWNGGVLVVGGPFAYGCGGYAGSYLERMLPVVPKPLSASAAEMKYTISRSTFECSGTKSRNSGGIHRSNPNRILSADASRQRSADCKGQIRSKHGRCISGHSLRQSEKRRCPWLEFSNLSCTDKKILGQAAGRRSNK